MRLVLGGDADATDTGIECVGQREIDNSCLAAEVDGWLGTTVGEFFQTAAAPPGKNVSHGVACQRLETFFYHFIPPCP